MKTITRGWPPARRKAQALRIRQIKPWDHATGPRTVAGKIRAAQNGYKRAVRCMAFTRLQRLIREQRRFINNLELATLFSSPRPPREMAGACPAKPWRRRVSGPFAPLSDTPSHAVPSPRTETGAPPTMRFQEESGSFP